MKKRVFCVFLAIMVSVVLASCRYRVTDDAYDETQIEENETEEETVEDSSSQFESSEEPEPEEETHEEETLAEEIEDTVTDDEEADRKEYDSSASAEVYDEAESSAIIQTEETLETVAAPSGETEAESVVYVETVETADLTITDTVEADSANDLTDSEDGEIADSAFTYYVTLLNSRLSSRFECQKYYIYWETVEDHKTIYKTSDEHEIILLSGCYDVSAKLLEDALVVDDGWISRKSPGAIVKVVSGDNFEEAAVVYAEIYGREGLSGTDAVKNGRVIVISDTLLSTSARRVAAAIYIAKELYPEELQDVDADEALSLLTSEEGSMLSGTYIYTE